MTTERRGPAHAWMPVSPCTSGCIDSPRDTAGTATVLGRLVGVGLLLLSFPAAHVVSGRRARDRTQRRYARALLRCCGLRLRVVDTRGDAAPDALFAPPGHGVLVVAGHVSWADILVLAAVQPVGFVARGDLVDWPMIGRLAQFLRVVPLDRTRLRQLPQTVSTVAGRLAAGERIAVFPEGTTWCGRAYGAMRPALFQSAIDTDTPVQPVRLRYLDARDVVSTATGFVGDEPMVDSLLRVLRTKGMTAEVVLAPIELPGTDRRELAARCDRAVRGELRLDFADHGVLEGERNTIPAQLERVG